MSFFSELKRRNVTRVAIAYGVGGWLITEVASVLLPTFAAPDWVLKVLIAALMLGFPLAILFSWAYELTPDGLKKESDIARDESNTGHTAKKLDLAVIVLLVAGIAFLLLDRFVLEPGGHADNSQVASDQAPGHVAENARTSIAVLPFVDMSPKGDQAYFADGISEEILNVLARIDGLSVASRTSSFAYKGLRNNIPAIARELDVNHILEGSVRKSGNRVRITAQLIETGSDRHLWSHTYERDLDDIFAIQEEIAEAILAELKTALKIEDTSVKVTAATENMTAYQLYLEGRGLFLKRRNFQRALTVLEKAVQLDPGFARAWEQLAATYAVVESWGLSGRPFGELALEAADQALQLDPALSMPHAVRGSITGMDRLDWEQGFQHLDLAIQADLKNATAYLWRAIINLQLGYFDAADADIKRCLKIDPAYGNCRKREALIALIQGDEPRAIDRFMDAEIHGNGSISSRFGPALVHSGHRYAVFVALAALFDRLEVKDTPPYALILDALGGATLRADQIAQINDFLSSNDLKKKYFQTLMLATRQFDQVFVSRYGAMLWQPPLLDPAAEQHFKRLAADLKAPQYWRKHGFPPQCKPLGVDDYVCTMP